MLGYEHGREGYSPGTGKPVLVRSWWPGQELSPGRPNSISTHQHHAQGDGHRNPPIPFSSTCALRTQPSSHRPRAPPSAPPEPCKHSPTHPHGVGQGTAVIEVLAAHLGWCVPNLLPTPAQCHAPVRAIPAAHSSAAVLALGTSWKLSQISKKTS